MEFPILMMKRSLIPLFVAIVLLGCTKDITVDLPKTDPYLVVEGTIQAGQPPLIMLTRTQSYFDPADLNSFSNLFVHGATINVSDGVNTAALQEFCSSAFTAGQLAAIASVIGVDPVVLANANVCIYTDSSGTIIGQTGRSYTLHIAAENKTLSSVTSIPNTVHLDSTWFKLAQQNPNDDTLGYVWAKLHDPDTLGNGYRFLTRRINHYSDGSIKDNTFTGAIGSAFYDKFINGLTFDFFAVRGHSPYSSKPDDDNAERGYFKRGDTVVVKFVSIGYKEYDFYNSFEANVSSQGDLFSTPANVRSNINGGLGIWAGWGVALDTVVCQ